MKEVNWGVIHGEGFILCTCDNCGCDEDVAEFDDWHPDYRQAQSEIRDLGLISTKINGEWFDFCCKDCRNKFIKDKT